MSAGLRGAYRGQDRMPARGPARRLTPRRVLWMRPLVPTPKCDNPRLIGHCGRPGLKRHQRRKGSKMQRRAVRSATALQGTRARAAWHQPG